MRRTEEYQQPAYFSFLHGVMLQQTGPDHARHGRSGERIERLTFTYQDRLLRNNRQIRLFKREG